MILLLFSSNLVIVKFMQMRCGCSFVRGVLFMFAVGALGRFCVVLGGVFNKARHINIHVL